MYIEDKTGKVKKLENDLTNYFAKVRGSESAGKKYAENPFGSASGLYQFTKDTWKGLGYDWKDRFNTKLQQEAAVRFTNSNINYLRKNLGIEPTHADLYGAHFLGAVGYKKLYKTADNRPISDVMSPRAIHDNPFVQGKSVGFVKNWLSKKMSLKPSASENYDYEDDSDISMNLFSDPGKNIEAPAIGTTKEDIEAQQAKAELIEKQKEKDFLAELQANQQQAAEIRNKQYEQSQQEQEQDPGLDPSYYQVPQIELPNYEAIKYQQEQNQGQIPQEQYKDGGSIPQRYKNMGFTHVGQKKSGDGQHKWKVLAKKGDKYKVVQGGYRGMKDFSQHGSKKRQDNFWSRMGGRDSAKANDPFSPLYWHKRLGKWEDGGEIEGEVECTNCGWSWNKSESTEKDMYNCHKCGGQSTGEAVSQFQKGGKKMGLEDDNEFFPKIPINPLWDRTQPVTKKSVSAPVRKAKNDIKKVDPLKLVMDFATGNMGNTQNLQNGVITDKRSNTNYVVENGVVTKTFPVLTALNPDVNVNDKGVVYLDKHPESRGTPRGTYLMNPKADIYGEPGFRMDPVPAFGESAPKAKDIATHVTYPGEFKQRNPLYEQEAKNRYASYGCVNCRKPDIKYLTDRFKKGDTTIVIDSNNRKDAEFLGRKLFNRR